jgi:hypothetical protein
MTSVLVPDEAAGHLGAILLAFNREIFGSFLDEAEELAALGQVTSAVLIAGTVAEYFLRSPAAGMLTPEHRGEIEAWGHLRNQVAHGSAVAAGAPQARLMIDGVRRILVTYRLQGRPVPQFRPETGSAPHAVRGRYTHVPTSSADFIKRKREELDLEDRG